MTHGGTRDFGFFQWLVVGFMLIFGVLAILSIGAPILLLGLVLFGVMLGRSRASVAGVYRRACRRGTCRHRHRSDRSCTRARLWAATGATLAAFGAATFWWLRCHPAA